MKYCSISPLLELGLLLITLGMVWKKHKKTFWICINIVQGEALDKLKHNFELNRFVQVFIKTLLDLQSIKYIGILHNDIKEENILFNEKEFKIIDFGSSESVISEGYNKSSIVYKGVTYLGKENKNRKTTQ